MLGRARRESARPLARETARMTDEEEKVLKERLAQLREEHRDLDSAIVALEETTVRDQLQLTRMKKRKLQLKDLIARIEAVLLPDIIA